MHQAIICYNMVTVWRVWAAVFTKSSFGNLQYQVTYLEVDHEPEWRNDYRIRIFTEWYFFSLSLATFCSTFITNTCSIIKEYLVFCVISWSVDQSGQVLFCWNLTKICIFVIAILWFSRFRNQELRICLCWTKVANWLPYLTQQNLKIH